MRKNDLKASKSRSLIIVIRMAINFKINISLFMNAAFRLWNWLRANSSHGTHVPSQFCYEVGYTVDVKDTRQF